jgi:hypothetical protein
MTTAIKLWIALAAIALVAAAFGAGYWRGASIHDTKCKADAATATAQANADAVQQTSDALKSDAAAVASGATRETGIELQFSDALKKYEAQKRAQSVSKPRDKETIKNGKQTQPRPQIPSAEPVADDLPVSDSLRDYRAAAIRALVNSN